MIVLAMLGVDITPIFALIGGASFIMAFALFDEGDFVDIGGVAAAKAVFHSSTRVTTPDNQVIVVPNPQGLGQRHHQRLGQRHPPRRVKTNFDAAGIHVPYPQQELRLRAAREHPALPGVPATGQPAGAPDYPGGDEGRGA